MPRRRAAREIPIEERSADEVRLGLRPAIAPAAAPAANLAFDVTPAELIAAIVTDAGVLRPPFAAAIARALAHAKTSSNS